MKNLQKNIFLCFVLLAHNTQPINTMDMEHDTQEDFKKSKREDRPKLTKKQEAELNKAMNSDGTLRIPVASKTIGYKVAIHALTKINTANKPSFNPLDSAKTIALGVAVPVADSLEHDGRKYFTNASDDEIENKMIGERAFLLSIAGCLAMSNPASAAVMVSSSLLYSIYKLQSRINFREKYIQDPVKTINDLNNYNNQNSAVKFTKEYVVDTVISDIPGIIVGAPTLTGVVYAESKNFVDALNKKS